ncbi:MAG: BMC domain-containing protein [Acidobacteria bacterium]|nr:BMC domain-containing protein [Acidobacteriota bacterium]
MNAAIGALEFNSIARGIEAADAMAKAAEVEIFTSRSICPGKYLTLVHGNVSSVSAAIQAGREVARGFVVDEFVIPNVHPEIFPALTGTADVAEIRAVGVLETYSALTGILAGDAAAKAAPVALIEVRVANGIGGKAVLILTGDVASVEAAIRAGIDAIAHTGLYVTSVVIPAPHAELTRFLN